MNELEAFQKGVCCFCETNIMGELTQLETISYKQTALCPECWIDSVRTNPVNGNRKAPVQMGLPLVGEMPAIISMPPLAMATLIAHESKLLKGAIIRVVDRGTVCNFDIIFPSTEARHGIEKFLRGTVTKN